MKRRSSETGVDDLESAPRVNKPFKLKSFFRKFCSSTSLHGFQHLGNHNTSTLERVCWVVAVCISVLTCTWLISRVYLKWLHSPVIVSFAETATAVRDIPFPAVTVCSGNKVRKSVFDFKTAFHSENWTAEVTEKMGYASLLCQFLSILPWAVTVDQRAIDFLEETSTPLDKMIGNCKWRDKERECEELFTSVLTDSGLCYTFNILRAQDMFTDNVDPKQFAKHLNHSGSVDSWSLESGYKSKDAAFPFHSASSGSHEGLSFYYLQNNTDLCDSCGFPAFGFKVLIHSPVDFPQVQTQYFRLPPGHDVVVGLQPNMIITSTGLQKNLEPQERRCFMSHERRLHFFGIYTAANCELECFVNATLLACNCSSFYMPRAPNTTICGAGSTWCLDIVRGDIHLQEESLTCNCLPSCSEIQFNMEVSETKVRWSKGLLFEPGPDDEVGRMQVYFKRSRFITRRRSELYGPTDFIANCGGLLGLFLGFSFLSLVEIIFFLLVKPLVAIARIWCKPGRLRSIKEP